MLAYPKQERITLGSVESWGSDLGIMKDPPKSIMTRRIDRVGQTQDITQMIDDSGDRACESILVYARGRNPMVSTEYSNYGTAGGQSRQAAGSSGITNSTLPSSHAGTQAKLPYTIMRDGAFRPPVLRQEDLLPLSRQPRVWTSSFANPEFPAYVAKTMMPNPNEIKAINVDKLQTCARPTSQFSVEKPVLVEGFVVKSVLDNPLQTSAGTNARGFEVESGIGSTDFSRGVNENVLHTSAGSNLKGYELESGAHSTDFSRGVNENNLQAYSQTGVISGITIEPLQAMNTETATQQHRYFSQGAGVAGLSNDSAFLSQQQSSVHLERTAPETFAVARTTGTAEIYQDHGWKDMELEANRPVVHATTNLGGRGEDTVARGDYHRLAPRADRGGFAPNDGLRSNVRGDMIPTLKNSNTARKAHAMRVSR